MSHKLIRKYPPYEGNEPFLFLCFAEKDAEYIEPLLSRLWIRGCKVWYTLGKSEDLEQEKQIQERMKQASLVIAVCSEQFHRDLAKSRMMVLQSRNVPIISVDREPTDNLSAGFREGTPHIAAYRQITADTEAEVISTEGFSQDLIGTRRVIRKDPMKTVFAFLLTLTIVAAIGLATLYFFAPKTESQEPEQISALYLETLPDDPSELEQYPNLEKIIISADQAERAEAYLDRYTVVIKGA